MPEPRTPQHIIRGTFAGDITPEDAAHKLDDLHIRGAFNRFQHGKPRSYLGYDYQAQKWIELHHD